MLMLKLWRRYSPTRLRKTQAATKFNYAGDEHFIRFTSLIAEFVEQEAEKIAHA